MNATREPDDRFDGRDDAPASPALQRDLARWLGGPQTPGELDERVLAAAHAEMRAPRPSRPFVPRRWWPLTAAAAGIVALGLWRIVAPASKPMRTYAVADIDRNGHVDVLDAFALAREIKRHRTQPTPELPLAWDVDGDGRVDARDVELVTSEAVRIHS